MNLELFNTPIEETTRHISTEEYDRIEAVRSSHLSDCLQSVALFKWNVFHGREATPSMILGTMAHTAILEPDKWKERLVIQPEFSGTGSRKAKADWLASLPNGAMPVNKTQYETVQNMVESVLSNPVARALMEHGQPEVTITWNDPTHGLRCKARYDWLTGDEQGPLVMDLKTTRSAHPEDFEKSIYNYKYDLQSAHYMAGLEKLRGMVPRYCLLAVENKPPYGTAIYALNDAVIDFGQERRKIAMDRLANAIINNDWKAYPSNIKTLAMPNWAFQKIEEQYE